jgi:hypothetical protein
MEDVRSRNHTAEEDGPRCRRQPTHYSLACVGAWAYSGSKCSGSEELAMFYPVRCEGKGREGQGRLLLTGSKWEMKRELVQGPRATEKAVSDPITPK